SDAKKYSNNPDTVCDVYVTSISDMYKDLMKLRFGKNENTGSQNVKNIHYMAALELLFPQFSSNFKHLLEPAAEIDYESINSCGIMVAEVEKVTGKEITFRFLHRTYAEYLMA